MVYLLVMMMNIVNLEPVIVKDCVAVKKEVIKDEADLEVKKLSDSGFICQKNSELVSYSCQNVKTNVVAKVVASHELSKCKEFPKKMSEDLKKLLDRKDLKEKPKKNKKK